MKTESRATHPYSLFEWSLILTNADQTRWLKRYSHEELAQPIFRHKQFTHGFVTPEGDPAAFAIAFPQEEGENVHIAFIVMFVPAMPTLQAVLHALYPRAKTITFIRRNKLCRFSINNLARMLALCPTQAQPKLQNA